MQKTFPLYCFLCIKQFCVNYSTLLAAEELVK